jgi:uncharacterized membrane protein YfcA
MQCLQITIIVVVITVIKWLSRKRTHLILVLFLVLISIITVLSLGRRIIIRRRGTSVFRRRSNQLRSDDSFNRWFCNHRFIQQKHCGSDSFLRLGLTIGTSVVLGRVTVFIDWSGQIRQIVSIIVIVVLITVRRRRIDFHWNSGNDNNSRRRKNFKNDLLLIDKK